MSLIYNPQGSTPGALITEDTQIEWDGLLMGMNTWFGYKELTGWDDLPGYDDSSVPRPRQHGEFPGSLYGNARVTTFQSQIYSFKEYFAALRREFMLRTQFEQEEKQLVIRQHGQTLMAFARVTARTWKINRSYFGGYPIATVQWTCSDPRRYSLTETQLTLAVPSSSGGLDWTAGLHWDTGLEWGTVVTGSGSINNDGETGAPLRFEFVGPLTPPYFVNAAGEWALGFNLPLASGEILEVDSRLGTVLLNGVDRLYSLAAVSDVPEDCIGKPGSTSVQFVTNNTADTGHVNIFWRNATM